MVVSLCDRRKYVEIDSIIDELEQAWYEHESEIPYMTHDPSYTTDEREFVIDYLENYEDCFVNNALERMCYEKL